MEGSKITEFNRACQLNDNISRVLVTKVDPRLVDALVAHTLGTSQAEDGEAEGEGEPVAAGAAETSAE